MAVVSELVEKEIKSYEESVQKFLTGQITPETFQRIRLQHGVYGQRQDGVQMIRIKIPMGIVNATQLECIAELAETIAHNNAHITTRQDLQIHYVDVKNTPALIQKLENIGLTTREACGNTVRNLTASPSAGVDPTEAFDVTPYAEAMMKHLLRNPICQNLPRKFKIAFDGGGLMTAYPMLHDLGLVAKIQNGKKGFEVFVGGGLGSSPRVAKLLDPFMEASELIPWAQAVIRVFDRLGERKVRSKARMKFVIDKLGFEEFKRLITQERQELTIDPAWNNYLKNIDSYEEKPPVVMLSIPEGAETPDYIEWKKTNVWEQKQKGYSMVEIRLTTGDMKPAQMRKLADISRRYCGENIRLMVHQNILIRWVRNQDLPAIYHELKSIDFVKKDAQTIYDITSCPGTDTCRLGIASSMGLARTLEAHLYKANGKVSQVAKDLRIKISGCPNSCGQHYIANIGLYGGAIPSNGHTVPAFQVVLGGHFGRDMAVGQLMTHVPSKNVPDAVVTLVSHYAETRQGESESFNQFYARLGKPAVLKLLEPFRKIPSYEENPSFYIDWEGSEEFGLQKGVIGECAGAAVEPNPPQVSESQSLLQTAEALLSHGEFESAAYKAYEVIIKAADALLFYRYVPTFNDIETTHEFENHFVKLSIFPEYPQFHQEIQNFRKRAVDEGVAKEWVARAQKFLRLSLEREPAIIKASPRRPVSLQPDNLAI